MAFNDEFFSPVGGQPGANNVGGSGRGLGINEFSYSTPDDLATVIASGYFNDLRDRLTIHNFIHVASSVNEVDPDNVEFAILEVQTVPAPPSTADVIIDPLKIVAA